MRKIITGLYISLDGVVESPDQWQSPEQWQLDLGDSKMAEVEQTLTAETDTILLGQNTYQMWKDYWTTSELAFANHINNTKNASSPPP